MYESLDNFLPGRQQAPTRYTKLCSPLYWIRFPCLSDPVLSFLTFIGFVATLLSTLFARLSNCHVGHSLYFVIFSVLFDFYLVAFSGSFFFFYVLFSGKDLWYGVVGWVLIWGCKVVIVIIGPPVKT